MSQDTDPPDDGMFGSSPSPPVVRRKYDWELTPEELRRRQLHESFREGQLSGLHIRYGSPDPEPLPDPEPDPLPDNVIPINRTRKQP